MTSHAHKTPLHIDQVLHATRERQRAVAYVLAALQRVDTEARREALAIAIDQEVSNSAPAALLETEVTPSHSKARKSKPAARDSYSYGAKNCVLAAPNGVTKQEIHDATGHPLKSLGKALRTFVDRGEIERRGDVFYPPTSSPNRDASPAVVKVKRNHVLERIVDVYMVGGGPYTVAELCTNVQKLDRRVTRSRVEDEVAKMKNMSPPALVQVGVGANNAGTYALSVEARAMYAAQETDGGANIESEA